MSNPAKFNKGPNIRQVGHRKYDDLLMQLIQAIGNNISREDLIPFFIDKLASLSNAHSIVVLQAQDIEDQDGHKHTIVLGSEQRGVHPERWKRFNDKPNCCISRDTLLYQVIEDGLEIDVWGSIYQEDEFVILNPLFDIKKGGWLAGIQLPRATARHFSKGLFIWYSTDKNAETPPPGSEQDWRILKLFRGCYEMAGYNIRKTAQAIIRQRQELLRMLTSSILNHEINARISFFKTGLEYSRDNLKTCISSEDACLPIDEIQQITKNVLRRIDKQLLPHAELLRNISDSIMGLTRRVASGPTDPIAEIHRALELLAHKASSASVLIEPIHPTDTQIEIISDPALLMHVMVNLIKNAIEALEPITLKDLDHKKRIWIAIEWMDQQSSSFPLSIKVCDNGPGISPELLHKIFEPGFTTKKDGHGLGLAICKMIAGYLGGSLDLSSSGDPTVFNLRLPKESPKIADLEDELKREAQKA